MSEGENPDLNASGGEIRQREELNPFLLMKDIIDKLKLLDYENVFCKKRTLAALTKPLAHTYFAIPHQNPNEQFYYFVSLVSFLFNEGGFQFTTPGQFDDPNATCTTIVDTLKKVGIPTDFAPAKIRQGNGETVCYAINALCDWVLAQKGFKFLAPKHLESKKGEEAEDDDEDDEIMADETIVDDEEEDEVMRDYDEEPREVEAVLESNADPAEWKIEVERVSSQLTLPKGVTEQKDWRTHYETMEQHHKLIQENLNETKSQLDKMATEITSTLEKIETREKIMNGQFDNLVQEYKTAMLQKEDVTGKFNEANEKVTALTNELQGLVEELAKIKEQMENHGTNMTDSAPLVKLKNALNKVKEEITSFDIRVGVLESMLMQARIKARKQGAKFGA